VKDFWEGFHKEADLRDTTTLQPHQERVIKKLKKTPGLLLYHGLGSGKSLSAIAAAQGDYTDVVVPAALRTNYQKEVKKHTKAYHPEIMSYEQSMKRPQSGSTLVMDEAQAIGQSSSQRSKAMMEKAKGYNKRILLSGTPVRNHPHELGPMFNVLRGDNQIPSDPKKFDDKFIQSVKVKPSLWARVVHGAEAGEEQRIKNPHQFSSLVKGFVDYHAPSTEGFPAVTHETIRTPMSGEQMKYYNVVMGRASPALRYKIRAGMPVSKREAKSLNSFLSGARQITTSTAGFGGKEISPKLQTAVTALDEMHKKDRNFRGLVYSNFLDSGAKPYAKELENRGISHAVFDGSLTDKKRQKMVEDYNAGRTKVLIISGAGAQGLDLKGTKLVQILSPHWNEATTNQVEGRAVRFGSHEELPDSEKHVLVQRYQSTLPRTLWDKVTRAEPSKSVDEYLTQMGERKSKLNSQFLDILKYQGSK
jgi:SNF2 family DNA or RNA helicase